MPQMNWKQETRNNPVYPAGTYKVRCESWERVKASTGTPQIRWKCLIEAPIEHQGRTIIDHTALTEKALWRVANMVSGFGVKVDSVMDTDGSAFNEVCQACVGRSAYWRNAEAKDPNGNPKNDIVEYKADDQQEMVAFDHSDLSELPDFVK